MSTSRSGRATGFAQIEHESKQLRYEIRADMTDLMSLTYVEYDIFTLLHK